MTIGLCLKCGSQKWGVFSACDNCGTIPQSQDDMAISLFLSDHYFSKQDLERFGCDIANGQQMQFDENSRKLLQKISLEISALQGKKDSHTLPRGGNIMGIIGRLFNKNKTQQRDNDDSNMHWNIVTDWVRQGDVRLAGLRRSLDISEAAFAGILVAAKLNGWTGGQEFFIVKDQQGVLKQLENGMGVYGGDASELGMKFVGFIKNNHQDLPKQMENFITICNEGGFTVEIGDE